MQVDYINLGERRRATRLSTNLGVRLNIGGLPGPIEATVKDISERGMFIEVADNKGRNLSSLLRKRKVFLDTDLLLQDNKFKSWAKIVWSKKEKEKGVYRLGVKFLKINPQQSSLLFSSLSSKALEAFPEFVRKHIPNYILYSRDVKTTWVKRIIGEMIFVLANIWVRRQKAFVKKTKDLSKEEVKTLYDYESRRYLAKHARTTNREDDSWRLWLAQAVMVRLKEINKIEKRDAFHLDLFSGTGLSYLSQAKVFHLNNIKVHSCLVDYSIGMLKIAREITIPQIIKSGYSSLIPVDASEQERIKIRAAQARTVELLRGDATNLTCERAQASSQGEIARLSKNYFDAATIMFGIGSVSLEMALSVSAELLKVLREKARFAITDVHKPIAELAGRWSWPMPVEFRWPWLEKEGYIRISVPYVFNRVWGWYDPTLYPHLMKLCVIKEADAWYGWDEIYLEVRSLKWDFGMPVMPTYKQILVKVRISEKEAAERAETVKIFVKKLRNKYS